MVVLSQEEHSKAKFGSLMILLPSSARSFLLTSTTSSMRTDHTKLFLLGLLRTVTALATEASTTSLSSSHAVPTYASAATTASPSAPSAAVAPLTLRLARRTDVPSIQRCNLATLPENYNQQFYSNHLRQWGDLAIVATDGNYKFGSFPGIEDEKVVAYVLGKVEERTVMETPHDDDDYNVFRSQPTMYSTYRFGHVTSLAVLETHRRRGLAVELMKQLHHHLANVYGVDSVGLHVRKSNRPACKLYQQFGYIEQEVIPNYYQDGEDAYYMKKDLFPTMSQQERGLFGLRRKPWEVGPLRLPRTVGVPAEEEEEEETPELLTGTQ